MVELLSVPIPPFLEGWSRDFVRHSQRHTVERCVSRIALHSRGQVDLECDGIDTEQVAVEQNMQVRSQQQSVCDVIIFIAEVGHNVRGLYDLDDAASGYPAHRLQKPGERLL